MLEWVVLMEYKFTIDLKLITKKNSQRIIKSSKTGSYVDVDKWHPRTEVTITDLETG